MEVFFKIKSDRTFLGNDVRALEKSFGFQPLKIHLPFFKGEQNGKSLHNCCSTPDYRFGFKAQTFNFRSCPNYLISNSPARPADVWIESTNWKSFLFNASVENGVKSGPAASRAVNLIINWAIKYLKAVWDLQSFSYLEIWPWKHRPICVPTCAPKLWPTIWMFSGPVWVCFAKIFSCLQMVFPTDAIISRAMK